MTSRRTTHSNSVTRLSNRLRTVLLVLLFIVAQPLLGALAFSNVAVGNALAAGGMGYYLWKIHPHIREALAAHPLGETADGE